MYLFKLKPTIGGIVDKGLNTYSVVWEDKSHRYIWIFV